MSVIKVGVFDSGIGGLSIAKAIKNQNPSYQLHYFSDAARHPYGSMNEVELLARCERISEFLIEQGCSVIVVACNTATVHTIANLRQKFAVKFVGVEPGVKPAATSAGESIAIWATENTLKSGQYQFLKQTYGSGRSITDVACKGLADEIELVSAQRGFDSAKLQPFVEQSKRAKCDTIVLGCTHYGLVKTEILQHFSQLNLQLIDTAEAVAKQACRVAGESKRTKTTDAFYTSGGVEYFNQQLNHWWPQHAEVSSQKVI